MDKKSPAKKSPAKGGKGKGGKSSTKSSKAGLTFPVGRVARLLKQGKFASRVGGAAPVFFAAVLEYLAAELVELAGTAAIDGHKKRITPRYINLAIRADEEFNTLLQGAVISGGGVQPHINKVLVKKQKKSGKKSSSGKSKKSKKSKGEKKEKSKSKKAKKEKKGKKGAKTEA